MEVYTVYGTKELNQLSEQIASGLKDSDFFNVKLIVSELVTNAYVHGNHENSRLPIHISVIRAPDRLTVKVEDMSVNRENPIVPSAPPDPLLMEESGRGLFILSNICKQLTYDEHHVTAEYILGGKP